MLGWTAWLRHLWVPGWGVQLGLGSWGNEGLNCFHWGTRILSSPGVQGRAPVYMSRSIGRCKTFFSVDSLSGCVTVKWLEQMRSLEENLGKSVGAASRGRRLWAVKYFMARRLRYVCVSSCTVNSGLRHHRGSALVSWGHLTHQLSHQSSPWLTMCWLLLPPNWDKLQLPVNLKARREWTNSTHSQLEPCWWAVAGFCRVREEDRGKYSCLFPFPLGSFSLGLSSDRPSRTGLAPGTWF